MNQLDPQTEKLFAKASELGHLLLAHPIIKRFEEVSRHLEKDQEASAILKSYLELTQQLQDQEAQGKPVEPEQKRTLAEKEKSIRGNKLLAEYLASQQYYIFLTDQIQGRIQQPEGEPPAESSIITPGQSGRIIY